MRERLFDLIEVSNENDTLSKKYDLFMIFFINLSLIPLMVKRIDGIFLYIDKICMIIFIIDYIFRIITADLKIKKGFKSFFIFPFTPMAIIDLLSILPSLTILNNSFKILKLFRIFRTFRVLRIFKAIRYSKNMEIIGRVFKKQKDSLIVVAMLALGYIFVSAIIMFNFEPDTFNTFFDAIYWATVSLTTVGYGDIHAVSTIGRFITIVSTIFGIAIVALPAGIVTAGYMEELNEIHDTKINHEEVINRHPKLVKLSNKKIVFKRKL